VSLLARNHRRPIDKGCRLVQDDWSDNYPETYRHRLAALGCGFQAVLGEDALDRISSSS
jgi:hypothetical protein